MSPWPCDESRAARSRQRLAALKAKARRRAATKPWYADDAEREAEMHENVLDMMPLQLRSRAGVSWISGVQRERSLQRNRQDQKLNQRPFSVQGVDGMNEATDSEIREAVGRNDH